MFNGDSSFNQDVSSWDFSSVFNIAGFLSNSTNFSTQNYDKLLISLDSQTLNQSLVLDSASNYCNGESARLSIINNDL